MKKTFLPLTFLVTFLFAINALQVKAEWITDTIVASFEDDGIQRVPYAVDEENNFHLLFNRRVSEGAVMPIITNQAWYVEKPDGGQWSEPMMVSDEDANTFDKSIASTPGGQVYMAYEDEMNGVEVLKKEGEQWNEVDVLDLEFKEESSAPLLLSDEQGFLHLICVYRFFNEEEDAWQTSIIYASNSSGSWVDEKIEFTKTVYGLKPVFDIAADGSVHILYENTSGDNNIAYYLTNESGEWEETAFESENQFNTPGSVFCRDGEVHVLISTREDFMADNHIHYYHKDNGEWQEPVDVNSEMGTAFQSAVFNPEGELMVVYLENLGFNQFGALYIATLEEAGFVSEEFMDADEQVQSAHIAFDSNDSPVIVVSVGDVESDIFVLRKAPSVFDVAFVVEDEQGYAIEGASITLDGYEASPGEYLFNVEAGTYSYEVEKQGYVSVDGELTVTDQDITVEVTLEEAPAPTYDIEFVVLNDEQETIEGAVVTLDGETAEAGQYVFNGFEAGTYDYTVEKTGYFPVSGEVSITDQDEIIEVVLSTDDTGIPVDIAEEVRVFPNPATTRIEISSGEKIARIDVFDLTGKKVSSVEPQGHQVILQTGSWKQGVYMLHVQTASGVQSQKIQIIQ